eukprot:scaffold10655_cov51-Cyclotella_meneghiniana.AAC.3
MSRHIATCHDMSQRHDILYPLSSCRDIRQVTLSQGADMVVWRWFHRRPKLIKINTALTWFGDSLWGESTASPMTQVYCPSPNTIKSLRLQAQVF